MVMPASWSLPADHSAARIARRHVGDELADWPNVEDIELVASELTTNAVEHGAAPIDLALELIDGHLRLTVSNADGLGHPERRLAGNEDAHGRGVTLVSLLAQDWGWSREGGRLCVWADFSAV